MNVIISYRICCGESGGVYFMTLDETIVYAKEVAKEKYKEGFGREYEQLVQWLEELKEYKRLEEKLSIMFNGDCRLSDVVESLKRQICEPGKDHPVNARILTYEDAEKWNEYLELEEQGRLLKLPCKIGDTLWWIQPGWEDGRLTEKVAQCPIPVKLIAIDENGNFYVFHDEDDYYSFDSWDKVGDKYALLTKEDAEAKLKEMENELESKVN